MAADSDSRTPSPAPAWLVQFETFPTPDAGILERYVVFDEPEGEYAECATPLALQPMVATPEMCGAASALVSPELAQQVWAAMSAAARADIASAQVHPPKSTLIPPHVTESREDRAFRLGRRSMFQRLNPDAGTTHSFRDASGMDLG